MKTKLTTLFFIITCGFTHAQNILFVNDNNAIAANTTTMLTSMSNSSYATYSYWSVPDSATILTSAYMSNFDLVIWYCSTDGVGLGIWDGSVTGNAEVINYVNSGKPFWLIGLDIMYQQYGGGPTTFSSGDFAYDYLGLQSYDAQSYVNDGSLGVSNVIRKSGIPTVFPATIQWTFPTLWYVDACTSLSPTINMYEMGGALTYPLLGSNCMFQKHDVVNNIMSTFFDPALMDTEPNRVSFINTSINYLLTGSGVNENINESTFNVSPNPSMDHTSFSFNLANEANVKYFLSTITGTVLKNENLGNFKGKVSYQIDLTDVKPGMYFLSLTVDKESYVKKIIVQ
ncbi:MAG: T9SS type A sorting domain-containing protein [Bacteroidetes bacterium]|nr:T9SS type A sorting domain-containing protein [Bacteroidota bacterium]